ncbi:amidase [Sneathiella chinensis]|uniref:Amidase n=1 Tax=Sneathiella chinensis TaxID=349750 RepID=A0ABQ5U5V9_9PROT|nr:amidase [Sneathiella chinensis]GLQ06771.1 amidase [Sneathiella chinensis]
MDNSLNSVTEQAAALAQSGTTSSELVEKALDQFRSSQHLNAFVALNEKAVRRQAEQSDERRKKGRGLSPVDGIPIAVKDNYWTLDHPTTACSGAVPKIPEGQDATIVRNLREAGAVIFGKTNMHEWAYGATNTGSSIGPTRHPLDPNHITGGSSGGSALAVADGVVGAALGSDTGGSVRIPSAACGIVGYKPSYGRASRYGVLPLSWSLDAPGLLTRDVKDLLLLAPYLLGADPQDPSTFSARRFDPESTARGKKVLALTGPYLERRADVEDVIQGARERLGRDFDWNTVQMETMEPYFAAWEAILHSEASSYHQHLLQEKPDGFGDVTIAHLVAGNQLSAVEYLHAQKIRQQFMGILTVLFEKADILALPTLPVTAPGQDEVWQEFDGRRVTTQDSMTWFCWMGNLAGLPSITVPAGLAENGFPVGLMMMAKPGEDEYLLQTALQVQTVLQQSVVSEFA